MDEALYVYSQTWFIYRHGLYTDMVYYVNS